MSIASKHMRRVDQLVRWARRNMKDYQYEDNEALTRRLITQIWEYQKDPARYDELWPRNLGSQALNNAAIRAAGDLVELRRQNKW